MTEAVTPVKTPEWLLLLEKKTHRPHRLAHEIGAGAPCLICEGKCPGLDLHFWRKLCRNCKCKKEDHDVKDDDGYEQFEILLGAGGKHKKRGAVLKIKVPEVSVGNKSVPFDWVPPNVSEDVAAQYMEQLPSAKLPISGSDGALYRKQQLERQMPLHDLDASHCHNLTPHEIEELQKYLDNLKNNVVGQGRVTKVPTLYTEERLICRGPATEQNSSHRLPSSRSEQSLRSMPPLPSKYNAVPRPFARAPDDEDLPPPPLPTSLPPDKASCDPKTPGSFVPHGFGSCVAVGSDSSLGGSKASSRYPHNVAYSTAAPGRLASDFSWLHLSRDVAGCQQENNQSHLLAKEGSKSKLQFSSSNIHSSEGPGQTASAMSHIVRYPDGATPLLTGLMQDVTSSVEDSTSALPCDGLTMHSYLPHNIASSTTIAGQVAPGMSCLQNTRGHSVFPNDGSHIHSQYPQDIASSISVAGQVPPGMSRLQQARGTSEFPNDRSHIHSQYPQDIVSSIPVAGQIPPGMSHLQQARGTSRFPNDRSHIHSQYPQDIASSTSVAGQVPPGMSHLQQARGTSGFPNDRSHIHSQYPQDIASSISVAGQVPPGISHLQQARGTTGFPNDGSHIHSQYPQDIASSTSVAGQVPPGMSHLQQARGTSGFPNDGSHIHSQYPKNIAQSASMTGQEGGSFVSDQLPTGAFDSHPSNQGSRAGGNAAPLNTPLHLQESNEPWSVGSQIPATSYYERTLQPRHDVSVLSDVNCESMPRSAHMMRQSRSVDDSLADLSAQEQSVRSHLDCWHCGEVLLAGDVAVFAERAGDNTAWHPNCFVCQTCDELLVDLIYFFNKGNVYCGRHFAELLDIPRCFACDELIFVKEYTVAEGKTFHVKHFCCYECDDPLAGKQYVLTDDQPTCLDCYQEIFGKRCHTCRKQIAAGEPRVGWKELNWHAEEECFCCHACKKSLLGGRFVMKDQQPYCNKECVNPLPAAASG